LYNTLEKVATAPFALIGSLFGGEKGQDLSVLFFAAGGTDPQSEVEVKKLEVMTKALLGRPALHLEIVGGCDRVADEPALREMALEDEMRNFIWTDRRLTEPDITLDQIQLEPGQKLGLIRRLYYKMYPSEAPRRTSFGTSGGPTPTVSGQRGNLGVFQRSQATISRQPPVAPKPPPPPEPSAGPGTSTGTDVTETTETPALPTAPKQLTLDEMKAKLLERITVDDEAFRQLAEERAKTVREYLINRGQVPAERVSLVGLTSDAPAAKGARVELRLK
jgi:hypothetical protein